MMSVRKKCFASMFRSKQCTKIALVKDYAQIGRYRHLFSAWRLARKLSQPWHKLQHPSCSVRPGLFQTKYLRRGGGGEML